VKKKKNFDSNSRIKKAFVHGLERMDFMVVLAKKSSHFK